MSEIQEVESQPETEIEVPTASGGIVETISLSTQKGAIEDQLYLAENIGKLIEAQNKIRLALLKLAQPGDWVVFGKGDSAKAELGAAGALRVGSTLGVSFTGWSPPKKEKGTDDLGEWYRWEFECDATFRNRTVRVWGRAGSRDKFFGKAGGEWKPLTEVDEGNIKMAGRRAAMKEGVKILFGLHHMDPAFLQKNGIVLASAGGYDFKNKEEKAADVQAVTVGIEKITFKEGKNASGKPWKKYTVTDAEGAEYSTFSDTFANTCKAAKESKKTVTIHYKKTSYGNEIEAVTE